MGDVVDMFGDRIPGSPPSSNDTSVELRAFGVDLDTHRAAIKDLENPLHRSDLQKRLEAASPAAGRLAVGKRGIS